jgi:hypothetical protein
MRNLKRVLALALALVMTLGLMVITGSAASYPDQEQISDRFEEAITVLTELGVFRGKGDGSFAPKDILTRGEAATLIYRVITGDVNDEQVVNYKYASFTDVTEDHYAAGYITYAANGGYVVGAGNGYFNPDASVTGVQVLTIMLRALGYGQNGEFVGNGWEQNVLTTARDNGLLKGVATDNLSQPATRELVSQLIFNSLTQTNMVTYNAVRGYIDTDAKQTLGYKTFGLQQISGVVTANEWADLNGDSPKAAGKTVLRDSDGKYTTYNVSTEIADLGESRVGWASGKDSKGLTVLTLSDSGLNQTWENEGAATSFVKNGSFNTSSFASTTGLTYSNSAVDFVNFDDYYDTTATAEIRIVYSIDGTTVRHSYAPNTIIDADALEEIRDIFRSDDYADGWVIVGTTYTTAAAAQAADVSNDTTWRDFQAKYLDYGTDNIDVTSVENGEWLKAIDNDNDGTVDYIFKVVFSLDEISNIATNGNVTLYDDGASTVVRSDNVSMGDDVAKGDVVLVTTIDGVTHITKADTKVATAQTINYKDETVTTTDGDVYGQSGITNDTGYASFLIDMDQNVAYDVYYDYFGYIRAYHEVEGTTTYGLLTEAYTTNTQNGKYVTNTIGIAEVKLGSAALAEYQVTNYNQRTGNYFFTTQYPVSVSSSGKVINSELYTYLFNNDTGRPSAAITNVAKYALSDDGINLKDPTTQATNKAGEAMYYVTAGVHSAKTTEAAWKAAYKTANPAATTTEINNAWTAAALEPVYEVSYVTLDAAQSLAAKAVRYEIDDSDPVYEATNNTYINAVHDTAYYLVNTSTNTIKYFTDYTNLPAVNAADISAIYAVAENTNADSNSYDYWVANVIVIELNNWITDYDSIALAHYNTSKTVNTVRNISVLDNKTSDPAVNVVPTTETAWNGQWNGLGFYKLYDTTAADDGLTAGDIDAITSNYNTYGIYAGTVTREEKTDARGNYIMVNTGDATHTVSDIAVYTDSVPVYRISDDSTGRIYRYNSVSAALGTGDTIIWVMNGTKTAYIVLADDYDKPDAQDSADWVKDLQVAIVADSQVKTLAEKLDDADAALTANDADAIQASITELTAALKTATGSDVLTIANKLAELQAALGGDDNGTTGTDEEKAQAVIDAYKVYEAAKKAADADQTDAAAAAAADAALSDLLTALVNASKVKDDNLAAATAADLDAIKDAVEDETEAATALGTSIPALAQTATSDATLAAIKDAKDTKDELTEGEIAYAKATADDNGKAIQTALDQIDEAYNEVADLLSKAEKLAQAYAVYADVADENSGALPSAKDAAEKALLAAYNELTEDELATLSDEGTAGELKFPVDVDGDGVADVDDNGDPVEQAVAGDDGAVAKAAELVATTKSPDPTLEEKDGKSSVDGKVVTVAANVTLTTANVKDYVTLGNGNTATVSGKTITISNKTDGKTETTDTYTWKNEEITLKATFASANEDKGIAKVTLNGVQIVSTFTDSIDAKDLVTFTVDPEGTENSPRLTQIVKTTGDTPADDIVVKCSIDKFDASNAGDKLTITATVKDTDGNTVATKTLTLTISIAPDAAD